MRRLSISLHFFALLLQVATSSNFGQDTRRMKSTKRSSRSAKGDMLHQSRSSSSSSSKSGSSHTRFPPSIFLDFSNDEQNPTSEPTHLTESPTIVQTAIPTKLRSESPTISISATPSFIPTISPEPTTMEPSAKPSLQPTLTQKPLASASPSRYLIRQGLPEFTLEYQLFDYDDPTESDIVDLVALTNLYLRDHFMGTINDSTVLLDDFVTEFVERETDEESLIVMVTFKPTAYYNPISMIPTTSSLVEEVLNAFSGGEMEQYIEKVQELPESNLFAGTIQIFLLGGLSILNGSVRSNGGVAIAVTLPSFILGYNINSQEYPKVEEFLEVQESTRLFIQSQMMEKLDYEPFIIENGIALELSNPKYSVYISYSPTVIFDARLDSIPASEDLDSILVEMFVGNDLMEYISMLQRLETRSVFSMTTTVVFRRDIARDTPAIKEIPSNSSPTAGIVAGFFAAFLLFGWTLYAKRQKYSRKGMKGMASDTASLVKSSERDDSEENGSLLTVDEFDTSESDSTCKKVADEIDSYTYADECNDSNPSLSQESLSPFKSSWLFYNGSDISSQQNNEEIIVNDGMGHQIDDSWSYHQHVPMSNKFGEKQIKDLDSLNDDSKAQSESSKTHSCADSLDSEGSNKQCQTTDRETKRDSLAPSVYNEAHRWLASLKDSETTKDSPSQFDDRVILKLRETLTRITQYKSKEQSNMEVEDDRGLTQKSIAKSLLIEESNEKWEVPKTVADTVHEKAITNRTDNETTEESKHILSTEEGSSMEETDIGPPIQAGETIKLLGEEQDIDYSKDGKYPWNKVKENGGKDLDAHGTLSVAVEFIDPGQTKVQKHSSDDQESVFSGYRRNDHQSIIDDRSQRSHTSIHSYKVRHPSTRRIQEDAPWWLPEETSIVEDPNKRPKRFETIFFEDEDDYSQDSTSYGVSLSSQGDLETSKSSTSSYFGNILPR